MAKGRDKLIVELLDKAVIAAHDKAEAEHPRSYDVIHPSELFDCMRLYMYKHLKYDLPKEEPRLLDIFRLGYLIHKILQQDCVNEGLCTVECVELPVSGMYTLEGHVDILLTIDGELVLVDVKSVGGTDDWYGDKKWREIKKNPPSKYILQVQIYMGLLRQAGIMVNRAFILFYRKANSEKAEFEVQYDDFMFELALDRARILRQHMDDDTLPEREGESPDCERCKYCKAREICWNEG